jgi:hypothetical protein
MKNFKILFLLAAVSLLSACSQNTSNITEDCKNSFPKEEHVGIYSATKLVERTITLYFSEIVKDEKKDISACSMTCSSPQYTKVNLEAKKYSSENPSLMSLLQVTSDRELCVPVQRACPEGGFAPFLGLDLSRVFEGMGLSSQNYGRSEPLTGLDAAVYGSCPDEEGPGGPEGCLPDYVLNTESNTCVQQEMSCTEEELDGIGAETGYKQFNTMTNEYDLCQAETCQIGYTLGLGICNPDIGPVLGCTDAGATNYDPAATEDDGSCIYDTEIYGCMDSRASNYDPAATVEDMSCMCDGGGLPYNPITGCDESGGGFPGP